MKRSKSTPEVSRGQKILALHVDPRELGTLLAALRFHQDENLQGGGTIPDEAIADIATDGGTLDPLGFAEIDELCQRLNLDMDAAPGLHIDPPHPESSEEPLFRVVYIINLNAGDVRAAAEYAHRIMTDPQSMPPVLQIIDQAGVVVALDLSAT